MRPGPARYLLVILLLLLALGLTWAQRWSTAARAAVLSTEPTAADSVSLTTDEAGPSAGDSIASAGYLYFLDVEGWYRITPYETVVRSPYDFTARDTEALAAALPPTIGLWQQVGEDAYIADDPAVVYYLNHPTVAMERTYRHPSGQNLTLAVIGNQGEDSFLLFSHTPETCYPGQLWNVVEKRRESALLDDGTMYAQYLLTQHAQTGERLMVLFWYLWDNPQRDSRDGVLSVRVNLRLAEGQSPDEALGYAWQFVRALFPATIPWERF
jgi:hypothetical protein